LPHPQIDAALYQFAVELQIGIHISLMRDVMGQAFAVPVRKPNSDPLVAMVAVAPFASFSTNGPTSTYSSVRRQMGAAE
jgi:hypothetical protein